MPVTLPRLPSAQEFAGWNADFVTETLRVFCRAKVEFIKDQWAAGSFSSSDVTVMGLKQAEMLGALRAYAEIAGLEYEDIVSELAPEPVVPPLQIEIGENDDER